MSTWKLSIVALCASIVAISPPSAEAGFTLYNQNFESPTGFVNDGGDINIFRTVNENYGNQPAGFAFAQTFTVETLHATGTQAFGTGYSDPQHIGGNFVLGMLSVAQDDRLSLSFNLQGQNFLNFRLNISSIDLDRFGGTFNTTASVPVFKVTLFDNPSGSVGLSGNGTILATTQITGLASTSRSTFNWTQHTLALNAGAATNGNVTMQIDELNTLGGGYAALDNFLIVASNTPGDVSSPVATPEPATIVAFGLGVIGLLSTRRARRPVTARAT